MAHRLHYMDNHMTLGRGSREQVQGDSGHGKDVAWSPLYPTALAAKSNTPLPHRLLPRSREVPGPLQPQGTQPLTTLTCSVPCHPHGQGP